MEVSLLNIMLINLHETPMLILMGFKINQGIYIIHYKRPLLNVSL